MIAPRCYAPRMRIAGVALFLMVGLSSLAVAEDRPSLEGEDVIDPDGPPPRFAFTAYKAHVSPVTRKAALEGELSGMSYARDVGAMAADKSAYWIATDIVEFEIGCGSAPCPPPPPPPPAQAHATFLWQRGKAGWDLIVWDLATVISGKDQAAALKLDPAPSELSKKIDAGAEEVVKLFETSIADPKTMAATVSTRKDVVLFGNEAKERAVGGAKVKAKLEAWKLGFKVRDGIQAGLASKTVAWVAANVDAKSAKKPKDKPVPYRLLAIYEKTGADWKLVHAHFSFIP